MNTAPGRPQQDPLRQASRDLLTVSEEEFGRLILDIHDGPVQNMFAALSQINQLRRLLEGGGYPLGPEARQELEKRLPRVTALLEASLTEIRTFIGTFRPPDFRHRPLAAIVEGLVLQHEELSGATVELELADDLPEIPVAAKIACYRILQEALANAWRHSGSLEHRVVLAREGEGILLRVEDGGRGFDPERLGDEREGCHIGLRGIRDRAAMLGGTMSLWTRPGRGTQLEVRLPVEEGR